MPASRCWGSSGVGLPSSVTGVRMSSREQEERRAWFRAEVIPLEADLRRFAERLARPGEAEANDLVQDVFAKMIALPNWREIDCPGAFAKRSIRNLALDAARRSAVVKFGVATDAEIGAIVDERPDAETVAIGRDELRRLQLIIEELPDQVRRVFTLRKIYGLLPGQIAVTLGISVSTVEKHLSKGLRICSEKLAREPRRMQRIQSGQPWSRTRKSTEKS